jgi:hypothetical protein
MYHVNFWTGKKKKKKVPMKRKTKFAQVCLRGVRDPDNNGNKIASYWCCGYVHKQNNKIPKRKEGRERERKERKTWHLMLRISGGDQNVSISTYKDTGQPGGFPGRVLKVWVPG